MSVQMKCSSNSSESAIDKNANGFPGFLYNLLPTNPFLVNQQVWGQTGTLWLAGLWAVNEHLARSTLRTYGEE
jgi:hypothetical protein